MLKKPFEIYDERARRFFLGTAALETIFEGTKWSEGPCYFRDGDFLLFSDIPNDRVLKWTPELGAVVWRQPSNFANGQTRDRQGRLISCEHGTRRVTRTEWDGTVTVLAEGYEGRPLNSPNDVVVSSDGAVWFTDPDYGIMSNYEGFRAEPEQRGCFVFRLDPTSGALSVVADDFVKPNGLAFSADETTLYICDSGGSHVVDGPNHIRAFTVEGGDRLTGGAVFVEVTPGVPDGIRLDEDGNLWSSCADGVVCFAPDGAALGKLLIGEPVSNLCFGGSLKNRLFITARSAVYAIYLDRHGIEIP